MDCLLRIQFSSIFNPKTKIKCEHNNYVFMPTQYMYYSIIQCTVLICSKLSVVMCACSKMWAVNFACTQRLIGGAHLIARTNFPNCSNSVQSVNILCLCLYMYTLTAYYYSYICFHDNYNNYKVHHTWSSWSSKLLQGNSGASKSIVP